MLLLGCLLVLGFSVAPRVMLALAWLFSDRWQVVWSGEWLAPLLGIIFLPYTTIMYLLVWSPNGIEGWDWLWIILGLILDVMHWGQWLEKRRQVPGYSKAAGAVSGSGTASAMTPAPYAPTSATRSAMPPAAAAPAGPPKTTAEVVQPVEEPKDVPPEAEAPPRSSPGA